jgi:hypothetical protein
MKYLLLFTLLVLSPLTRAAEPRLAIVADASLKTETDLLTVELSHQPVVLLERAEIERVFAEQKLAARGLTQAVQVGRLLRADGVLLVSRIVQGPVSTLACRFVAVETGAVLDSQLAPPEMKDPRAWIASLAETVLRLGAKLTPGAVRPVAISVAGLRAGAGLEAEETPLAALLAHALAQQPGFIVLERQRLLALAQEKEFGPDLSAPFWASRLLLGGSIEHNPEHPGGLLVKARLQPPQGAALEFAVAGTPAELGTVARELARRTAEALHAPPAAIAWDAPAEAARFGREARAALAVGLWDLAESAGGAAWALGERGVELAQLRYRIQLERLLNTDRMSDQFGHAVLQTAYYASALTVCDRLAQRRDAPYPFEPFAGFRFPEDITGARRLLDLYWTWTKLAPRRPRAEERNYYDRSGALTFCLASLPLVLVQRQPEAAQFAPELETLKTELAETLPRLLAADAAQAGKAVLVATKRTTEAETAARGAQHLRFLQGFFALFAAGTPDRWRAALPALLAEEVPGEPARLQLRTGLLKAQGVAPLYIKATWPREIFHETGLTRPSEALPDDRLLRLAMLDGSRLEPAARHAAAAAFAAAIWELRAWLVRQPDEARAFIDAAIRRFSAGVPEAEERTALRTALHDVRRRIFLHVIHAPERVDPAGFWDDLSIANWKQEDAATFNQALLARIAELKSNVTTQGAASNRYELQRFLGWQADLRRYFPALPAPDPGATAPQRAPLQVTHFWSPYVATGIVPIPPEEGFRIWGVRWIEGRVWAHVELRRPLIQTAVRETVKRVFLMAIEPGTDATQVIEVPNLGHMNEGQPLGGYAVSPEFIVVTKTGSPALKLRRATGEWKAYDQFITTRQSGYGPVIMGREAYLSLGTEIVRWNLESDASSALVRTRREPAESPLDNPQYTRVWVTPGPDGGLVVNGANEARQSVSYRFTSAASQWEKRTAEQEREPYPERLVLDPAAYERWESRGKSGLNYLHVADVNGEPHGTSCEIPLTFILSQKDHAALAAGERVHSTELKQMEASLQSSAEKALETRLGIIFLRLWTPGFWFVPKEELAAYIAAHGTVDDPRQFGRTVVRPPAAPKDSKP